MLEIPEGKPTEVIGLSFKRTTGSPSEETAFNAIEESCVGSVTMGVERGACGIIKVIENGTAVLVSNAGAMPLAGKVAAESEEIAIATTGMESEVSGIALDAGMENGEVACFVEIGDDVPVDETAALYPAIDDIINRECAPCAVIFGAAVVNEVTQPIAAESDILDPHFLDIRIGFYAPVMVRINLGVEWFVKSEGVSVGRCDLVFFINRQALLGKARPLGIYGLGSEGIGYGIGAEEVEINPLVGLEGSAVGDFNGKGFPLCVCGDA